MKNKKILGISTLLFSSLAIANTDHPDKTLPPIKVIGITPISGVSLDAQNATTNIQSYSGSDLESPTQINISDFLGQFGGNVHLNHAQNNPFQPDLLYRGYTASPLLGNAQGLSVYFNGIRFNEPFGDAVNWDLLPKTAISTLNLMPGSNPMFGLNTLGGALDLKTKNGFSHPGHTLTVQGGMSDRNAVELESAGHTDQFSYYVLGSHFDENGWRDYSPSRVKHFYSNIAMMGDHSDHGLHILKTKSNLQGNGPSPIELLEQDYQAAFTHPDNTQNDHLSISIDSLFWFSDELQLSTLLYTRFSDRDTFNGDGSDYDVIQGFDLSGNGLNEENEIIITSQECNAACNLGDLVEEASLLIDQNGNVINPGLEDDEIAINNKSLTEQDTNGFSAQITSLKPFIGKESQFVFGTSFDHSDINYFFDTEVAEFTETRGTSGTGFIDRDSIVDAQVDTQTFSLFFLENIKLNEQANMILSGRYNHSRVNITGTHGEDSVVPENEDGRNTFVRFNPSIGMSYKWKTGLKGSLNYNESSRLPTPAELTCHDIENPCALPNSFLSDPPLEQVVTKTWEAGLGGQSGATVWKSGVFLSINQNDIYFLPTESGPGLNPGFFDNIGDTKRIGVELSLSQEYQTIKWQLNYSFTQATFEDRFGMFAENNPFAEANNLETVQVERGDEIPNIPKHIAKSTLQWSPVEKLALALSGKFQSSQFFRGDEANLNKKIKGFFIMELDAVYDVNNQLSIFVNLDNLFNKKHETFGLYGEPDEAPGLSTLSDTRFLSPGNPFSAWAGLQYTF